MVVASLSGNLDEEMLMSTAESQRQMRAAWYERKGAAREVLQVGELPIPEPGPGEVRVQVAVSGINPSDTKRPHWLARPGRDALPTYHSPPGWRWCDRRCWF